jgi:hypothetical protein
MLHMGYCYIWDPVTYGTMLHMSYCYIWDHVTFIMIHSCVHVNVGVSCDKVKLYIHMYISRSIVIISKAVKYTQPPKRLVQNFPKNISYCRLTMDQSGSIVNHIDIYYNMHIIICSTHTISANCLHMFFLLMFFHIYLLPYYIPVEIR